MPSSTQRNPDAIILLWIGAFFAGLAVIVAGSPSYTNSDQPSKYPVSIVDGAYSSGSQPISQRGPYSNTIRSACQYSGRWSCTSTTNPSHN